MPLLQVSLGTLPLNYKRIEQILLYLDLNFSKRIGVDDIEGSDSVNICFLNGSVFSNSWRNRSASSRTSSVSRSLASFVLPSATDLSFQGWRDKYMDQGWHKKLNPKKPTGFFFGFENWKNPNKTQKNWVFFNIYL